MTRQLTCILREEENRWTGRVYESKLEDGMFQYTYAVIAPLRFEAGHAITAVLDPAADKIYRDPVEVVSAMRHELHMRSTLVTK
jgi:uncharacterized protein (DUF2147 family)